MFIRQIQNNKNWIDYTGITDLEKEKWTKEYVLLAIDELFELLREVNYKQHIVHRKPLVRSNILEELIDTFKYLLSIAVLYNFEPEEFVQAFYAKSDIVDARWREEQIEWSDVLCVDIDGVIADYMAGYIVHLFDVGMVKDKKLRHHFSYNIADVYDLDKGKEELEKRKFQEQGGFAHLPVIPGAVEGLKWAKECGYQIALVSARPYLEVRRIYSDTIYWLEENGIPYDAIFWGKDKADIVFSNLYPIKPTWFIEDRDKHAIELANENIPVLLINRPYNYGVKHTNIVRVNGWKDIENIIGER